MREPDVTIVDTGFLYIISNGCERQRVIYSAAAVTQLSQHDHHQIVAALFLFLSFSVVVKVSSYIRLRRRRERLR